MTDEIALFCACLVCSIYLHQGYTESRRLSQSLSRLISGSGGGSRSDFFCVFRASEKNCSEFDLWARLGKLRNSSKLALLIPMELTNALIQLIYSCFSRCPVYTNGIQYINHTRPRSDKEGLTLEKSATDNQILLSAKKTFLSSLQFKSVFSVQGIGMTEFLQPLPLGGQWIKVFWWSNIMYRVRH